MENSYIEYDQKGRGVAFVGKDAVNLYRAAMLASALKMYARSGIRMTRGLSPTRMLQEAKGYTGKGYKRGEYLEAAADVGVWVETMKTALPKLDSNGEQI